MDLTQHYHNYIAAINNGCKPSTLDPFVHEGIVHNDSEPLSIAEYAKIITDSQASFPALHFHIDMLIVQPDTVRGDRGTGNVAVRIKLSFQTEIGDASEFFEHVFYRFEEGKIRRVWSMLDGVGLEWAQKRKVAAQ